MKINANPIDKSNENDSWEDNHKTWIDFGKITENLIKVRKEGEDLVDKIKKGVETVMAFKAQKDQIMEGVTNEWISDYKAK